MPLITFTTHASVKCAVCHCYLLAEWNAESFIMEVTPCNDCLASARTEIKFKPYLPFEPLESAGGLRCNYCGEKMHDGRDTECENGRHSWCNSLAKAEAALDALKDGGA